MRLQGTIIDWDDEHLFGFIKGDDDGDIFIVHASDIVSGQKALARGERVRFTREQMHKTAKRVVTL